MRYTTAVLIFCLCSSIAAFALVPPRPADTIVSVDIYASCTRTGILTLEFEVPVGKVTVNADAIATICDAAKKKQTIKKWSLWES